MCKQLRKITSCCIVAILASVLVATAQSVSAQLPPGNTTSFDCNNIREISCQECEALVALYNATNGDDWKRNDHWLESYAPSDWFGVEVELLVGVTELHLYGNDLQGELPPELGNLTNLRYLNVSENDLTGPLPASLGNLANLWLLDAHYNDLTGAIPAEFGDLDSLWGLHLGHNELSGAIPPEIGDMANLKDLDLSRNRLSGSIPAELSSLQELDSLALSFNRLGGAIPAELADLAGLRTLGLICNMLYAEDPTLIAFLDERAPNWEATQTVPPTGLYQSAATADTATLSWTPIAYCDGNGWYQIEVSEAPGGPYTPHGSTANKSVTSYLLTGLTPNTTYYVVVRSYEPALGNQYNALLSEPSAELEVVADGEGTAYHCHLPGVFLGR